MKRLSMLSALSMVLFVFLVACQALPPAMITPEQAEAEEAGAALQALVDAQVAEQGILGMVMAVRLPDGTVIVRGSGYADREGEKSWGPHTVSAFGSITKSFTAVVIMQLVEEGKLTLDQTIDTWFPEQPNGDKITVRMLLSHTSGLASYISGENVMDPKWVRQWTLSELIAEGNRLAPVAVPGSDAAHYSNTNYALLGLIIEAITGNGWQQELQSRIVEPLKLQETSFLGEEGLWGGTMVAGYFKSADGYVSTLELPSYPHYSTTGPAGAVVGSVADLLTFATALFDGELVSQETLAEMATPVALEAETGIRWGLGGGTLDMLPPGAFGMGGDIPGYHAFYMGVQGSQIVVTAMVNTEEGNAIAPSMMALEHFFSTATDGQ